MFGKTSLVNETNHAHSYETHKHHDNANSTGPHLEAVRFEFTHPTATNVCVAGTFNDWALKPKPRIPWGVAAG